MPSDTTTSEEAEQDPSYSIPPRPEVEPPQEPVLTGDEATDAVKVATYFMNLYPYSVATGDLGEWRGLSHPSCEFCAELIGDVEAYRDEEWVETSIKISETRLFAVVDGEVNYRVDLLVDRGELRAHGNSEIESLPAGTYTAVLGLVLTDQQWQVHSLEILSETEFGVAR